MQRERCVLTRRRQSDSCMPSAQSGRERKTMKAKKIIKAVCCIVAVIIAAALVLIGRFTYVTKYKITDIDSSISGDGLHEVLFQAVGEADFPFGSTHARIVLKNGSRTVTKYCFDVENDGGILYPNNWDVSWEEDRVNVTVSGEEQDDILYVFYFDGRTDVITADGQ